MSEIATGSSAASLPQQQQVAVQSTTPTRVGGAQSVTDEAVTSEENEDEGGPPATLGEKVGLVAFLLVGCLLAFRFGMAAIQECQSMVRPETSAHWSRPKDVTLKNGPPQFRYDSKSEKLIYQGALDEAEKRKLKELFQIQPPTSANVTEQQTPSLPTGAIPKPDKPTPGTGNNPGPQGGTNVPAGDTDPRLIYEGAIDELAFNAASIGSIPMLLVLKLGMLGGIFGALLRSLNDFVGTVCYKENFSLQRYWPLHVTRPFVGAILGCFTIILFNAGFLTTTGTPAASSAWWSIAVAFLAGFSTLDVTQRLRSTAKALFGDSASNSSRPASSEPRPATGNNGGAVAGGNVTITGNPATANTTTTNAATGTAAAGSNGTPASNNTAANTAVRNG